MPSEMRALSLLISLPLLTALTGCLDDPCRGADGPRVYVYGPDNAHRLDGSDPTAFGSITEAVDAADPGGAVCIAGGTWREPVNVSTEGVQLFGAGPDVTVLEAPDWIGDDALLTLSASDVTVSGLTVRDAEIGIAISEGASAWLDNLAITDNQTGLAADGPAALALEDVEFARNAWIGANITAGDDRPLVTLRGGRLVGNGDAARSPVGGLRSELDLMIEDLEIRDNAGQEVGDLDALGSLEAWSLDLKRPLESSADAPRLRVGDGLELMDSILHLDGSPGVDVTCRAGSLRLENLIVTEVHSGVAQEALRVRDCRGTLYHATLANLGGGDQASAVVLSGTGALTIANTAIVGYAVGVGDAQYNGHWRTRAVFEGSVTEAQLVSPMAPELDLRPQSDSPLLDSGRDLGVATDIHGVARPRGGGPDIGAYEY